ncbi:MAG: prolyl oligopeptidase family serine peptidase [Pirellulaceae bacterium]
MNSSRFAHTFALACLCLTGSEVIGADEPRPGKQVELEFNAGTDQTGTDQTIGYLLYLPKDYQKDAADKKWPVIFFLHGRGESNGPLSLVAKWGPPRMAGRGDELKYIIVSPQCPREDNWRSDRQQQGLIKLLDHIVGNYAVDTTRIYLTGLSMGGYGSWKLSASHPERFAAVAPICGGGDPATAETLKHTPLWVFHGDQDQAVPIARSTEMVEAVKGAGNTDVRYTTLEHVGHNCWSAAYATPELYEWFDSHTAK